MNATLRNSSGITAIDWIIYDTTCMPLYDIQSTLDHNYLFIVSIERLDREFSLKLKLKLTEVDEHFTKSLPHVRR